MSDDKTTRAANGGCPLLKAGVILGLTVATLLICWLIPAPQAGGEAGVEMYLPLRVGNFVGRRIEASPAELYILPKDTSFAKKVYESLDPGENARIFCSIVLSGKEKRSIHRPERCLPSQGWRVDGSHVVTVPLASGQLLKTTALLLSRPATGENGKQAPQSYFLYWFVGKDVTTPYQFERILLTNWDLLFHRVNHRWAYIYVQSDITQGIDSHGRSPEQTLEMLQQFIHDSVPYYMKSQMTTTSATAN